MSFFGRMRPPIAAAVFGRILPHASGNDEVILNRLQNCALFIVLTP